MYDAVVVGGSYAGMAAALQLARARRAVAVVDGGTRRNRFAAAAHGFLSRDGYTPDMIAGQARKQLLHYPSVDWIDGEVAECGGSLDAFSAIMKSGERLEARRLILATGVTDELPRITGLAELWGRRVFHCPYCHGYELEGEPIGVLAAGLAAFHHAMLIAEWGKTTLFANDAFEPDASQTAELTARGITMEHTGVASVHAEHAGIAVELRDGRTVPLAGLFVQSRTAPAGLVAGQLGCAMQDGPLGPYVGTNGTQETSVEGVFAAGDLARAAGSVTFAVADGAQAGVAAHRSLIFTPRRNNSGSRA